jgi:hypothetical protein
MVKELEYPDSIVPEMYLSTGITNGLNVYLTTDKPIIAKQAAWPGNKKSYTYWERNIEDIQFTDK